MPRTSDLAELIGRDPAFAAQLLRVVNSAAHSPVDPIASLDEAISRVGRDAIVELAWLQSSADAFNHLENDLMRATTFWEHSRAVAVLAAQIAERMDLPVADAFAAGLLHDIGLLLLFHACPEEIVAVLDYGLDQHVDLCTSERRAYGFDHAEVGAALATHWRLPDSLVCAIGYHHNPEAAPRHEELVACVALANQFAGEDAQEAGVIRDATAVLTNLDGVSEIAELVEASAAKTHRYAAIAL